MASCKIGHIYISHTILASPPKKKFLLCVCVAKNYFIWINTEPRVHNHDQLALKANCHSLIKHNSYLDLSRICIHRDDELENAQEKECISQELCREILNFIDNGLERLPTNQAKLIKDNLKTLLSA